MPHIPALWYFYTSVTYPQRFRRVKFVLIPPRFLQQQYLWNIAIQPAVGCYHSWTNIRCSGCSPLGEISLWNGTVLAYFGIQCVLSPSVRWLNRHKTIQRTSLCVCYVVIKYFPAHQSYAITINVSYMHQCIWLFGLAPSVSLRHAACERQWNWLQQHVYIHPTENKDCQFDSFAVTGGTVNCHYDKIVKLKVFWFSVALSMYSHCCNN